MLNDYIIKDYQEYLDLNRHTMPDGLYEALKSSERVPAFIKSLEKEMIEVDKRVGLDRIRIKNIVYDLTKMFLVLIERQASEKQMSDLEKSRLISEDKQKAPITDEMAKEYKSQLILDHKVKFKD